MTEQELFDAVKAELEKSGCVVSRNRYGGLAIDGESCVSPRRDWRSRFEGIVVAPVFGVDGYVALRSRTFKLNQLDPKKIATHIVKRRKVVEETLREKDERNARLKVLHAITDRLRQLNDLAHVSVNSETNIDVEFNCRSEEEAAELMRRLR